jgi:hypothetical protein
MRAWSEGAAGGGGGGGGGGPGAAAAVDAGPPLLLPLLPCAPEGVAMLLLLWMLSASNVFSKEAGSLGAGSGGLCAIFGDAPRRDGAARQRRQLEKKSNDSLGSTRAPLIHRIRQKYTEDLA